MFNIQQYQQTLDLRNEMHLYVCMYVLCLTPPHEFPPTTPKFTALNLQ
jgi:hypothetical protein